MNRIRARIGPRPGIWSTEHGLTALFAMLILLLFVVTPLMSTAALSSELGIIFFSLLSLTGVSAIARGTALVLVVAAFAIASIVLDWTAHFNASKQIEIFDILLRSGFVLLLASVVTAQVFRPGNISHHRVLGAIVVYMLAGVAWGYLYEIIAIIHSSAFNLDIQHASAFSRPGLFRYLSFETLTTLGYGDVLPVSPIARSFVSCEALFGQLYPAVMIARLVSLELSDRDRARVAPSKAAPDGNSDIHSNLD